MIVLTIHFRSVFCTISLSTKCSGIRSRAAPAQPENMSVSICALGNPNQRHAPGSSSGSSSTITNAHTVPIAAGRLPWFTDYRKKCKPISRRERVAYFTLKPVEISGSSSLWRIELNDTTYKRLTAVSGLIAALCAIYSVYLTLTTPKTFLEIADRVVVEDAASLESAVDDLESARKKIVRMALDSGIKNVAFRRDLMSPYGSELTSRSGSTRARTSQRLSQ